MRRRRGLRPLIGAVLALLSMPIFLAMSAWAGEAVWLVTPEEAALVAMPQDRWDMTTKVISGLGPDIVVHAPKTLGKVSVPINILVTFEPGKSGIAADMGTFQATLLGFFEIDLTSRIRDHIKDNRLDVKQALLPEGRHRIRLSIRDFDGNVNARDLRIHVVTQ